MTNARLLEHLLACCSASTTAAARAVRPPVPYPGVSAEAAEAAGGGEGTQASHMMMSVPEMQALLQMLAASAQVQAAAPPG